MPLDRDGYGFSSGDRGIERLAADIRELGREGVERIARGWNRHVGEDRLDEYRTSEQAALAALARAGRSQAWEEVRDSLSSLTEGGAALATWRAEHGDVGAKAERATLGAALALVAGDDLGREHSRILRLPMSEALPWLLAGDGSGS